MMRRAAVALVAAGTVLLVPAAAHAQREGATPTTIEVETSTVERDITVTTLDVQELDDDDDDSDKTGLWGLLGLLGLAGLAGLMRKRDDATYVAGRVTGDTTARGATTRDTTPDH